MDDIRKDIESAIESVNNATATENVDSAATVGGSTEVNTEVTDKPVVDRDETGKFKAKTNEAQKLAVETPKEQEAATTAASPAKKSIAAPEGWTAPMKQKFATLPEDVQAEISRREADVHRMMTSPDGELNLGRRVKETIAPYMAIIKSEGGEPVSAIGDLLNTAYRLRTADPVNKAHLVQQIIQQYGVDMSLVGQQQQQATQYDPLQSIQQELAMLKQQANPAYIQKQLQEQMENAKVQSEVQAFASDPANVHYQKLKPVMASLLGSGAAKDLKEAYEAACYADPEIRSMLTAEKAAKEQAKRNEEIAAKKKAASSVTGSPSVYIPNSGNPERSLRDEIAANLRAAINQ